MYITKLLSHYNPTRSLRSQNSGLLVLDPGCSSGRCDPGPGQRLLPLRSSRSPPVTASLFFSLNEWLSWCKVQKLLFVDNWNLFWERPRLFRADGLHPSRVGAELLSDNISRTLRSIWLVSQFSNNCYDDICSTHFNDSMCSVQSIQTCVCSPNSEVKIYILCRI